MAFSLLYAPVRSSVRAVSWCVRKELTGYQKRYYCALPKWVTGEHTWTAINHEEIQKRREDEPVPTLDEVMEAPMANLKRCRYARASILNKVYDACVTRKDLAKAQKLLVAYRHSLSFPRASLPMVVVRACIRAGHPSLALHYARNKVQYGVFPNRKVYNILMDACLEKGLSKEALAAYDLLLADEWKPDGMTYFLAARASLQFELDRVAMETANQITSSNSELDEPNEEAAKSDKSADSSKAKDEEEAINNDSNETAASAVEGEIEATKNETPSRLDFTRALDFSERCYQLEPRLGTTVYRVMVTTLLNKGHTDGAREMLTVLEADNKLPNQTLFNLKLDLCTSESNFEGAFALLRTLCSHDNNELGMPKEGLPRLQQAILATNNSELVRALEKVCAEVENNRAMSNSEGL